MSMVQSPMFLGRVLAADAAISGGFGILMIAGARLLGGLLGLPPALLHYAGLTLLPFAAGVLYLSRRAEPARQAVWAVIAANAAWVFASAGVLLTDLLAPTPLGYAFIAAQAIAVAALAEMQYAGLRRAAHRAV